MDGKFLKKSTIEQLKLLVNYMEENPEFARGTPVFGSKKQSVEADWQKLSLKLNSIGPPTRTILEWKKTWADLKSRTKKKIASNSKSLKETGGGLYRFTALTELEEIIDRTLFLSAAAAPYGKTHGCEASNSSVKSLDDCFQSLVETSPRTDKTIAVITPNRKEQLNKPLPSVNLSKSPEPQQLNTHSQLFNLAKGSEPQHFHNLPPSEEEHIQTTSYLKMKKTAGNEQVNLIRRQLRVAEQNAATSKEHNQIMKRIADATEDQAIAAKRTAESVDRMEKILEKFLMTMEKKHNL